MKTTPKPTWSWVFEFLPLIQAQLSLRAFTATFELKFQNSDPKEKMFKMSILTVGQNSDSSLKLNSTCQYESKGKLGFQNKAPDVKI